MVKTRGASIPFTAFSLFLAAIASSAPLQAPGAAPVADPPLARALAVLAKHPVLDGHNDLPWAVRENAAAPGDVAAYDLRQHTKGATDLPRMREGRLGAQFWSVYVPADLPTGFARTQLEQIELARRIVARYPDRLVLATTAD